MLLLILVLFGAIFSYALLPGVGTSLTSLFRAESPYGSVVNKVQARIDRLGAKDEKVLHLPFLYCQYTLGSSAAQAWLESLRNTYKDEVIDEAHRFYAARRCLPAFSAHPSAPMVHRFDRSSASYDGALAGAVISALRRAVTEVGAQQFVPEWRARVRHVFIDGYGQLYYRVVMVTSSKDAQLRSMLIAHNDLVEQLTTWRNVVLKHAGDIAEPPCICPEHFGIVGSGLMFTMSSQTLARRTPYVNETHPGEFPSQWRILLNVNVDRAHEPSLMHAETLTYYERQHSFPFEVDMAYWKPKHGAARPEFPYYQTAWFSGHDMATLFDRSLPEHMDRTLALERFDKTHPHAYFPPGEARDIGYLLRFGLDESEAYTRCGGTVQTDPKLPAFSRCFHYCRHLAFHVLGQGEPSTEPSKDL